MLEDRILIVDDDPSWQELLRECIESVEMGNSGARRLSVASTYAAAAELLERQHFHLAFVDLRLREDLRELEGKRVAAQIVAQDEGTSVVIATGHADVTTAITALKEWRVLDFVLKDAWDADKVTRVVRAGLAAARTAYRSRYESAVDFLRGDQETFSWIAQVLAAIAPAERAARASVARPDRRLADFLNGLLDGLYPLLKPRDTPGPALDASRGVWQAEFWSKALGSPLVVRFGRADGAAQTSRAVRTLSDEVLGIRGIVYESVLPPFEAFQASANGVR